MPIFCLILNFGHLGPWATLGIKDLRANFGHLSPDALGHLSPWAIYYLYHLLGPYNLSGEWGGIFGNVVNGNYHLSVNSYMNMYERFYVVDHAGFIKSRRAMFFIPFADGEDYTFFKRYRVSTMD